MKRCCVCTLEKPAEEFHKNSGKRDGLSAACKPCARSRARAWCAANKGRPRPQTEAQKEAARQRAAAWYEANRERVKAREVTPVIKERARLRDAVRQQTPKRKAAKRLYKAARRARMAGALATLTKAQWEAILALYENRCAYCQREGKMEQEHKLPLSRGGAHSAENIVPACRSCNAQKNAKTPEEWLN